MQTRFVAATGSARIAVTIMCSLAVLMVFGCAGKKSQTIQSPQRLTDSAQAEAVRDGVQALTDIRREHVLAAFQARLPDYTSARAALEMAVDRLRPSQATVPTLEYEPHAACLESALIAVVKLQVAERESDARGEAVAWEMFNQSVDALLVAIGPRNSPPLAVEESPDLAEIEEGAVSLEPPIGEDDADDISKPGKYQSGRWQYTLVITNPGSKSEGCRGDLFYDGIQVDEPAAPGVFYRTPWGDIQWAGNPVTLWGEHGWMPCLVPVETGEPLPEPWLTRGPAVMAMVLRDGAAPEEVSPEVTPWVRDEMAKLGVNAYRVEHDWFPLISQGVTLHDTKMLGTLRIRLAPARDDAVLNVIVEGSSSYQIALPRQNEATKLIRHVQDNQVAAENFYLAFRVLRAAPDYPKPLDIGMESNGQTVVVKDVHEIIIGLPGDRNSGCTWTVTSVVGDSPWGASVMAVGQPQFTPSDAPEAIPTRGGVFENTLRVTGTGKTAVELAYKRLWQADQVPEKTFSVTLDVQGDFSARNDEAE